MSEDLISRQAAIDALRNRWRKTYSYEGIGEDIAEECEIYLRQVPSVQPEQKNDPTCQLELHLDTMGDIPTGDGTASRVINVPAYLYGWKIIGYNWLEGKK